MEDKITVLVTGGTGFFGHNLVLCLLEECPEVGQINVLARHAPPTENVLSNFSRVVCSTAHSHTEGCTGWGGGLKDMEPIPGGYKEAVAKSNGPNAVFADKERVHVFRGDITDVGLVEQAMHECKWVFHACGDTSWWWKNDDRQRLTNVKGTQIVCQAATDSATVTRLIHTSTVDVMGCGETWSHPWGTTLLREDHPWESYSYKGFGYNYGDTKREGEEIARSYAHPHDSGCTYVGNLEVVVIRPASMIGPWDVTNQYGRVFMDLKKGSMPMVPCGGTSWCHVRGVSQAHVVAAQKSAEEVNGEVFICAGENESYKDVFSRMARCIKSKHVKAPSFEAPMWILWIYGLLCELWSIGWSRSHPEINPGMARYMSCHAHYYSGKAKRVLGYDPGSLREAIEDSYIWYCKRGRL